MKLKESLRNYMQKGRITQRNEKKHTPNLSQIKILQLLGSKYKPSSLDTTASKEGLERQGQLPLTEMHDSRGWQLSGV